MSRQVGVATECNVGTCFRQRATSCYLSDVQATTKDVLLMCPEYPSNTGRNDILTFVSLVAERSSSTPHKLSKPHLCTGLTACCCGWRPLASVTAEEPPPLETAGCTACAAAAAASSDPRFLRLLLCQCSRARQLLPLHSVDPLQTDAIVAKQKYSIMAWCQTSLLVLPSLLCSEATQKSCASSIRRCSEAWVVTSLEHIAKHERALQQIMLGINK